jgi:hypothetical protein
MLAAAPAARDVKFEIREITPGNRKLKKEPFIQEAGVTPEGVVRIARLRDPAVPTISPETQPQPAFVPAFGRFDNHNMRMHE